MKTILFMTMTINGMIADKNGSEDIFSEGIWQEFVEAADHTGCIVWGRKTYEAVMTWGEDYKKTMDKYTKVILTNSLNQNNNKNVFFTKTPQNALNKLEKLGFKETLLAGGATNNSVFAQNGLIDEVIINIESFIIGKGVPLFMPEDFTLNLKLLNSKNINERYVQNHYLVVK